MTTKEGRQLKTYHHVNTDREFRNDCGVWTTFLDNQSAVNRPFVDWSSEVTAEEIGFYTDSSRNPNLGFGCYLEKLHSWTFGKWEPGFIGSKKPSIAYLELYALVIRIHCWTKYLENGKFLVHCDNEAVVQMINNMSSSCKNCMY